MAWIDDRIWCHPKVVGLPDRAYRVYVNGLAYSAGMSTGGVLDEHQQKMIGGNARVRATLVEARLWDSNGDGATVHIHDWKEHNGKRDERRKKDRERKKAMRASAGQGADK